jgi:membrane fusion protein (multidrug efflux system)
MVTGNSSALVKANRSAYECGEFFSRRNDAAMAEGNRNINERNTEIPPLSRRRGVLPSLVILLSLGLIFVGGYWWFYLRGRVSTDDAYVMAHVASVSSRIDGTVSEVLVDNNDPVREGQVLLQIDPRDYQVAVDKAQAVAARIDADIQSEEVTMDLVERETQGQSLVADAALAEAKKTEQAKVHDTDELVKRRSAAQADLTYAQREFNRFEDLYRRGAGSQESRDNALNVLEKAKANLKGVEAQIASSQASFEASRQRTDQAKENLGIVRSDLKKAAVELHRLASLRAQKNAAQADLEAAKLQLSYCTIKASISGRIAQRSVQVGDRVQTGQPVMAVVLCMRSMWRRTSKRLNWNGYGRGNPPPSKQISTRATSITEGYPESGPEQERPFPCFPPKTPPGTGSRSCSAYR